MTAIHFTHVELSRGTEKEGVESRECFYDWFILMSPDIIFEGVLLREERGEEGCLRRIR